MINLKYPINLVLIDDDPDMLDLMEFYIKHNKEYKVTKFTSPKDALQFINDNDVAIAIVDINMDEMKGDEVLRKVNEIGQGTQVIIATASNNLLTFTSCYNEKASGFIFKPFSQVKFIEVINSTHLILKKWNSVFLEMMKRKHKESA
jgi:DNA-binding NtrC family response regulator